MAMEELHIPSSTNWLQPGCVDCSWDGHIAYVSRNDVIIFHSTNPLSSNVIACGGGGAGGPLFRTLNVSFAPKGHGKRILVSSEDGFLRLWDFEERTCERVNECHKGHVKPFVTWSHADGNLAVCVDEGGSISCWNLKSNTTRFLTCKIASMMIATCCPHNKDVVAVGCKGGLVCVINIHGKGSILKKLRGHDYDIVSFAWCPVPDNIFDKEKTSKPCLLASGARDQSIYFWRTDDSGLYENKIFLPGKPKSDRKQSGQSPTPPWTTICWPEPDLLLATSSSGELLACDLTQLAKGGQNKQLVGSVAARNKSDAWRIVKKIHSGIVYGIVCLSKHHMNALELKSTDEVNWRAEKGEQNHEKNVDSDWRKEQDDQHTDSTVVCTMGYDNWIVGTSWKKDEVLWKMPTFTGAVHALAISPIDGTTLAIGLGDKSIRLWNLSKPTPESMTFLWNKISGKVMALAWHPTKDGWLAYGTADGRVGIYYTLGQKQPLILKLFFKESVYNLQWGPALKRTDNEVCEEPSEYVLYCVGYGKVAVYDPAFPEQPPYSLQTSLKEADIAGKVSTNIKRSDLSWKPDFSVLAIGNEDGSIHLLYLTEDKVLGYLHTIKLHTRLIQDLAWHPESCITDVDSHSPYRNWLASASNETDIHVVDTGSCQSALQAIKEGCEKPSLNVPCVATLKGHLTRVAKLSWNPHVGGQLLSASYDECAMVWNVLTQQPLACYTNHEAPIFTCLWSPLNSDIVLTGTYDSKLSLWKISKQTQTLPCNKKKSRQAARSKAMKATIETSVSASFTDHVQGKDHSKGNDVTNEAVAVLERRKKLKKKSLFPVMGPLLNDEAPNAAILEHFLQQQRQSENNVDDDKLSIAHGVLHKMLPPHAALFGDQAALSQFFVNERTVLEKNKDWESVLIVDSWQGNIKETICHAIEHNCLTDYHVSMAPMVSHKTWVETCLAYADQLTRSQDFEKASSYLVAVHRVHDAVKLLAENGKIRQAVALAKSRFPSEDPLIETLIKDWASGASSFGSVALAAVCYASVGDFEQAARNVVRLKSAPRLLLASRLMMKAGKQDEAMIYARDAVDLGLLNADWNTLQSIFEMWPEMEHLKLWAVLYQILISLKDKAHVVNWLCNAEESQSPSLIDVTINDLQVTDKPICIGPELLSSLQRDLRDTTVINMENAMWLAVSRKMVLAVASAPGLFPQLHNIVRSDTVQSLQCEDQALRYILHAMAILNDHIVVASKNTRPTSALLELCVWLSVKGPLVPGGYFASPPKTPLHRSLRAYLASTLMHWLQIENCTDMSTYAKTLCIIDELKTDIFCADVLKYFKVTFRIDCIKQLMTTKLTMPKDKIDCPKLENVQEKMSSMCLSEETKEDGFALPPSEALEDVSNDCQEVQDDSEGKSDYASELQELTSWVQHFEDKRVKSPNPYVCYSALSLAIAKLAKYDQELADKLKEQMQQLWETIVACV